MELTVSEAAVASADATADAIQEASQINDDPEVAAVLDKAAMRADQTLSRVGWLRSALRRLFSRG